MKNSYADAVGTGLKYVGTGLTLLVHRHDGEVVPTVAIGTDLHVPMVYLCRRLTCWLGRNDAPIFYHRHRI
jgi:hypothetical protein